MLKVDNTKYAGNVGIFVDPLWSYDVFVLKNAVSTFLDRLINKERITLVFGGSPRANWDIRKFASVYRLEPDQVREIPFSYYPGNPMYNRNQMEVFTRALFTFSEDDTLKRVNKVFIFSNNPYTHSSTYLGPLIDACDRYRIPLAVITDKGDVQGSDPASGRYISRRQVDPNYPMEHQPHWMWGNGTKHRDIFDDHAIV